MQADQPNFNQLSPDERRVLRVIFRDRTPEAWIAVSGKWTGGRVKALWDHMPPDQSHYFASALLRPGALDRNDRNFLAGYTITLDDVGTKIGQEFVDTFAPPPTIVVETSAGNFQYQYVLETPVVDARLYGAFQDGIKHSPIWSKAGDGTGLARYQRLPGGVNHKNGFATRLVSVEPTLLYAVEDLADRFGVDLSPEAVGRHKLNDELGRRLPDDVLAVDPLFQTLVEEGVVTHPKRPQNEHGWVSLTCPWEHEHTVMGTGGAAYHADRGFRCHHTACQQRDGFTLRSHYWGSLEYRGRVFPPLDPEEVSPPDPPQPKGTRFQQAVSRMSASAHRHSPLIHMATPNPAAPGKTFDLRDTLYDPKAILRIPPRISTYFQRGQVTLLAAMPGIGKSLYATQLALAVAHEDPRPIGEASIKYCGDVILIAQEDPRAILDGRLQAVSDHFGLTSQQPRHRIHLISQSGMALFGRPQPNAPASPQGWAIWEYITQVAESAPLALVVIDTLSAALTGLDENSNSEMQTVTNMLGEVARKSKSAIVLVHHVSKGGRNEDGDLDQYSARGASSLAGAMRDIVIISKPTKDERDEFHLPKRNPYVKLSHAKSSYQMARDETWFEWVSKSLPAVDVDGSQGTMSYGVLVPATLSSASAAAAWAAAKFTKLKDEILKAGGSLRVSTHATPGSVREVLGLSNPDQKRLLETLENDGFVVVKEVSVGGGHTQKIVELTPPP